MESSTVISFGDDLLKLNASLLTCAGECFLAAALSTLVKAHLDFLSLVKPRWLLVFLKFAWIIFFFYFAEAAFDLFYLHIRQINFILLYLLPINFGIFHINKLVLFFPKKKSYSLLCLRNVLKFVWFMRNILSWLYCIKCLWKPISQSTFFFLFFWRKKIQLFQGKVYHFLVQKVYVKTSNDIIFRLFVSSLKKKLKKLYLCYNKHVFV